MIEGFKWMFGACFGCLAFSVCLLFVIYGTAFIGIGIKMLTTGIKKLLKKFKKSLQKDQK